MQTIYEGPDVVVRAELDRPGEDLLITFNSRSAVLPKRGFGETFCEKRGIPAVHFLSRRPHWWQTEDMKRAIDAVNTLRAGYPQIRSTTSYGSSMGAYGALVFSKRLGIDRAIAFSPQFSINGRVVPWLAGWEADTRGLEEIYRMEEELSPATRVFLIYDPLHDFDHVHAKEILRLERNVDVVPVPFSRHSTARSLLDAGVLGRIIQGLTTGALTARETRAMIRAGRTESLTYWDGLQAKAKETDRPEAAARAGVLRDALVRRMIGTGRALGAARQLAGPVGSLCASLLAEGRPEEALAVAHSFLEASEGHPAAHQALAQVLLKTGDVEESLRQAQLSLRLDKRNVTTRAFVASLLMRQARYPEAEVQLRVCLSSKSTVSFRIWRGLAASARATTIAPDIRQELEQRAGSRRAA